MNTLSKLILITIISFGITGGCGEVTTEWKGVFINHALCISDKDECKELEIRWECEGSSVKFHDEVNQCGEEYNRPPYLCKLKRCCASNECRKKSKFIMDSISNKDNSLTSVVIEDSCDVVARGYFSTENEQECEILAIDKECIDYEFISSDNSENTSNQCWLYECDVCSSESLVIDEEFLDIKDFSTVK